MQCFKNCIFVLLSKNTRKCSWDLQKIDTRFNTVSELGESLKVIPGGEYGWIYESGVIFIA
jgi:hypothetical protein